MSPKGDHTLPVQLEDLPIDGSPNEIMIIGSGTDDVMSPELPMTSAGPSGRRQRPVWCLPAAIFVGAATIALVVALAVGLTGGEEFPSESQVASWVAKQGYSSVDDVLDPESAQSKAVKFMTQVQALPTEAGSESSFKWMERYVLSVFFYATNGENWRTLVDVGFNNPKTKTCEWHTDVVLTSGQEIPFGASCDKNGRVDAIQIFSLFLSGTLPTELGLLTDMQYFVTPRNFIGGTIPEEIGNWSILKIFNMERNLIKGPLPQLLQSLTALEYFDVMGCGVEGAIPDWIASWTSLTTLALTENKLTGSIPDSLASLTNLVDLALDDNFLTGDLAVLEDLSELQNVYLEQNGFSQLIDISFLNKLTRLSALDISDNAFIGEVPVHLMALQSFIIMDVHDNALTSFPNNIDTNTQVRFLSIHDNPIEGAPFPSTASHMTHLRHLDITSTNFSGEMPSFLGDLKDMFYLFMADTEFKPGPIPDNYQNLTRLRDFSVKSAGRNGSIPLWFTGLDNLLLLDLDDNDLTGEIPGQLADMSNLRYLLLNRNNLGGEIPTEFNTASNIRVLLLDHNAITGDLNPYCSNTIGSIGATADCAGETPQVNCTCCICCDDDGDEPCNDFDRLAQYDPEWQDGYTRNGINDYDFNTDYNFTRL